LHIIDTTAIRTKFCTLLNNTKYPLWMVQTLTTNPRWRTAAILKNIKNAISLQRFDRSQRNLVRNV